jgi:hypothetical protein
MKKKVVSKKVKTESKERVTVGVMIEPSEYEFFKKSLKQVDKNVGEVVSYFIKCYNDSTRAREQHARDHNFNYSVCAEETFTPIDTMRVLSFLRNVLS